MLWLGGLMLVFIIMLMVFFRYRRHQRLNYIQTYPFPSRLSKQLKSRYPHLNQTDINIVLDALRDYFKICTMAKRHSVAMPSQAVDVAWHELILFTRIYQQFCRKALGRFLHHTPTQAQEGIKRAWRLACALENIDPRKPSRLPRLFAIDAMLKIKDGFHYQRNCQLSDKEGYCAGHIGCISGCAGDSGAVSDSSSDSGSFFSFGGDGDSGGSDGGSGCGGGCGSS